VSPQHSRRRLTSLFSAFPLSAQTVPAYPDDPNRFYIDFLPVEQRLIRRDGIQIFRIHYWDNALSPLAGRSMRRHPIRYDPRNLSRIFVKGVVERGYLSVPNRDLAHPRITLAEQRAALRELAQAKPLSLSEDNIFQTVVSQRLLVEEFLQVTQFIRHGLPHNSWLCRNFVSIARLCASRVAAVRFAQSGIIFYVSHHWRRQSEFFGTYPADAVLAQLWFAGSASLSLSRTTPI
jgi:hypothetical protein